MHGSRAPADQAAGLRRLIRPREVRVITVTGGKGGVGKTNISVNLAIAFANRGRRVMLMDADLGLGNVDILLGLRPTYDLSHVIDGLVSLEEIVIPGPCDIRLVPAASGIREMAHLSLAQHAGLVHAFSDLGFALDALLIDTAAGISDTVTSFSKASQEIVVVVCDEPTSIADAYALIKVLHREHGRHRFRILANMVRSAAEGRELFLKLIRVSDRFLDVSLDYMGAIPFDDLVRKAIRSQRAVVDRYPRSHAALAFKELAATADRWRIPDEESGQLAFFVEQLIQASQSRAEIRA